MRTKLAQGIDEKPIEVANQEVLRKRRNFLFSFWILTSLMVIVSVLAGAWLFTLFPLFILAPSLVGAIVLTFLYGWLEVRLKNLYMIGDTELIAYPRQDSY